MFDLNLSFPINFNCFKLFKSKNKHELKYQDFVKSLNNLETENIINLISLKLLNSHFDILLIIKNNKEIIKTLGNIDNGIIEKFNMIRIPIIKNGIVGYTLILGTKSNVKFKLKYDYINLLESFLT